MAARARSWVYMLRCADGSYYVGKTDIGLEKRLGEHRLGVGSKYTRTRLPVDLVWSEEFARYDDACAMERRLKGWRREKKEAVIARNWDALPSLPRRKS